MAAVDQHSGYRGDPWGRLQRTSTFLAETTFGTIEDADRAVRIVRAVHGRINGVAPDGRPYEASDPHLLRWVHVAEIDSFLRAHDRYGAQPLDAAGRDAYVAETAHVARALGAVGRARDRRRARRGHGARTGPSCTGTPAARRTARFILVHPPVPLALRGPYGLLSAAAVVDDAAVDAPAAATALPAADRGHRRPHQRHRGHRCHPVGHGRRRAGRRTTRRSALGDAAARRRPCGRRERPPSTRASRRRNTSTSSSDSGPPARVRSTSRMRAPDVVQQSVALRRHARPGGPDGRPDRAGARPARPSRGRRRDRS